MIMGLYYNPYMFKIFHNKKFLKYFSPVSKFSFKDFLIGFMIQMGSWFCEQDSVHWFLKAVV